MTMRGSRGFTLIELIATITLMALVLTTAPAAYEKIRTAMSFRAAVNDTVSALKRARVAAAIQGRAVELAVLPEQHQLRMAGEKIVAFDPSIRIDMHGVTSLHDANLPVFRFYPDGSATGGSLTFTNPAGRAQRIDIDWFSGQLRQSAPDTAS